MPITLNVKRPADVSLGKTQSYRIGLVITGLVDPAMFVCTSADGVINFDHVATATEMLTVTTDPTKTPYRTAALDLYLPAKSLADELILAVVADLQAFVDAPVTPPTSTYLSGASI